LPDEPNIEEVAGGMQITFLKDVFPEDYLKRIGLNERQIKGVAYVKKRGKITNSDYQKLCNVSERTALRDLGELATKGILKRRGRKKEHTMN
jgi:ATP-dependent DNA helicase RecG